jgi:hypothetical protein
MRCPVLTRVPVRQGAVSLRLLPRRIPRSRGGRHPAILHAVRQEGAGGERHGALGHALERGGPPAERCYTALAHTSGKRLFAKTGLGQTYGRKTEVRTVRFC